MGVEIFFPQRTGAEISHWLKFGIQCLNHSNSSWGKDSVGLVLQGMAGVPAKKKKGMAGVPEKKRNGRGSMQVSLHDSCAPATNHHSIFFFRSIFAFGAPPDLTQMSDPGRCPELLISQKVTA